MNKFFKAKIHLINENPENPRIIKDEKFKKLVKSIQDFPEMLELRPIVVNKEMMVLGGNMRLKACKQAGLKEVPVLITELPEHQQKEFIIKGDIYEKIRRHFNLSRHCRVFYWTRNDQSRLRWLRNLSNICRERKLFHYCSCFFLFFTAERWLRK